ncbi:MAG: hypothetical protein WCW68_13290 [Methanothrix sp.]
MTFRRAHSLLCGFWIVRLVCKVRKSLVTQEIHDIADLIAH